MYSDSSFVKKCVEIAAAGSVSEAKDKRSPDTRGR